MQVDWSKAPEWAKWHAFDENGRGYWYESEPCPSDELNHFISSNRFNGSGHHDPDARSNWEQSKAKRPKEAKNENVDISSFSVDWSKAPDWAMYHAFSKNGNGYWYEEMPMIKGDDFLVRSSDHMDEKSVSMEAFSNDAWKQSLTRRPHQTTTTQDTTQQILSERGSRYGKFSDLSSIDQALKHVMHQAPNWDSLKPHHKTALEMIQHKVSRILNGDPDYDDNWIDIEGYSRLGRDPNQ